MWASFQHTSCILVYEPWRLFWWINISQTRPGDSCWIEIVCFNMRYGYRRGLPMYPRAFWIYDPYRGLNTCFELIFRNHPFFRYFQRLRVVKSYTHLTTRRFAHDHSTERLKCNRVTYGSNLIKWIITKFYLYIFNLVLK